MRLQQSLVLLLVSAALLAFAGGCADTRSPSSEASSSSGKAGVQGGRPASGDAAAGTTATLSQEATRRLSPSLQRLLTGDSLRTGRVEPVGTRGGAPVYSVFLVVSDAAPLREAGLPLINVLRDSLVTARLTAAELRTAASVPEVRRIRAGRPLRPMGTR